MTTTATGSYDALWFATRAAPAAWVYVLEVQSSLADIEAALADDDWPTCVEAASETLHAVVYARLILAGYQGKCPRDELALRVCLGDVAEAALLRDLPTSFGAGRAEAHAARETALRAAAGLEGDLPIRMPVIRTAKGFFPSIRIGADIEALRTRLGLAPIDWMTWQL
ncbi:hypothetical protein AB0C14_22930 [Microbispora hainanensis]|uniref:hypothetical protein n=1 Tax=Microbispora TaxID=2005 RepID=UPI001472A67D|nr:hypothetical protein [Microbispora sp. H11081]